MSLTAKLFHNVCFALPGKCNLLREERLVLLVHKANRKTKMAELHACLVLLAEELKELVLLNVKNALLVNIRTYQIKHRVRRVRTGNLDQ